MLLGENKAKKKRGREKQRSREHSKALQLHRSCINMQKTVADKKTSKKKVNKIRVHAGKQHNMENIQAGKAKEKREKQGRETHWSKKQMRLCPAIYSVVLLLSVGLFFHLRFYLASPRCSQVETRHETIGLGFTCGWFRAVTSDMLKGSLTLPLKTSMRPTSLFIFSRLSRYEWL